MLDQQKEEVQKIILREISDGLKNGKLTADETTKIASFVNEKVRLINDRNELLVFLKDLADRWPIFNNIYQVEKGKEEQKEDVQAVIRAEELIKEGRLDEAIMVAKKATGE